MEPEIDVLDQHIGGDDHVGFVVLGQNGAVVPYLGQAIFFLNVLDELKLGFHRIYVDTSSINTYNNADSFTQNFNTILSKMGHAAIVIPEKIYFKIGEVCDLVGVQAHVLRYWETEFPMLSPQKNRSGQRSYRRRDVEIALRIKQLLYEEMFTIAGAKKKLQNELRETTKLKIVHPEPKVAEPIESDAPGLFDEELELDSIETSIDTLRGTSDHWTTEKREALKSLAGQLLELREMLKTDQTRDAARHLQNNRFDKSGT